MLPQLPSECFPASRAPEGPDNQGPPPGDSRSLGRRNESEGSVSALAGAVLRQRVTPMWQVCYAASSVDMSESKTKLPENWPTPYCYMDEGNSSAFAFNLTGIDDAEDRLPRSLCTDRYGVIQFAWIRG